MSERREYVRIDESFRITYKVISPPDGRKGDSLGVNISEGGISFPSAQRLYPGVIIELEIAFKKSMDPIAATGEVVWIKDRQDGNYPYIMGIRFIQITPRDRDRIYYHIHKRLEEQKRPSDVTWLE